MRTRANNTIGVILGTLVVVSCMGAIIAWSRTERPTKGVWYECGANESGKITTLVKMPHCCKEPGVVYEHCEVMLAWREK